MNPIRRSLQEILSDFYTEAATLPAHHPRIAWLLAAIREIEQHIPTHPNTVSQ